MASDTEVISPTTKFFISGDIKWEIRPIKIGQLGAVARAIEPFVADINDTDLLTIVGSHSDSFVEMASVVLSVEQSEIELLEIQDFVQLVEDIFAVNADFFTRRWMPQIAKAMDRIAQSIGQIASND